MDGNQLCGLGCGGSRTYTTVGIAKLCEGLEGTAVTSLECAARPQRSTVAPAHLSDPAGTPTLARSVSSNQLCGIDREGRGTYTIEGITKLCEGLKGSAVTSLECAAARSARST